MATLFSNALVSSNTTDAQFRGWATFIRDVFLLSGGWMQTADTGQMNFATVLAPTVANTKQGYAVFRMNDALQATSPVFVRLDFGGGASPSGPGLWLTVGTGSDGAGNITNKRFDGGASVAPTITFNSNLTASNSYGSSAPNRVQFSLFVRSSSFGQITVSLERSKDVTGADTGEAVLAYWPSGGTSLTHQRYIILGSPTQPPAEVGIQFLLSSNNPSSFGGDIGVSPPIPMKGYAQPPGTGVVIVKLNDIAAESAFTVTMYGAVVTYQHLNSMASLDPVGASAGSTRVAIRYD